MEKKSSVKSIVKYATPIKSMLRSAEAGEDDEYKSWSAVYDDEGRVLNEVKYFDDGDIEEEHSYSYDNQGRLLVHKIAIPGEGIEESFVTERNSEGYSLKITKMYADDPGEYTEYFYNDKNIPVRIEQYDADREHEQSEVLTYNENQQLIKREVKNHLDNTANIYLFKYNDKGWLMQQDELDEKEKPVNSMIYEYDADGNELYSKQTNDKGEKLSEIINSFNESGKITRRESRSFYSRITTFEYDERGNLTEEALSDENGFVITRNRYVYDDNDRLTEETIYETDLTRGGRDTHLSNRYDYEYFS